MINHPKSHQSRLRRRLIAIQLAVTLGAMLVAEAIVVVGVKLAEPGRAVNWLRSGASVALGAQQQEVAVLLRARAVGHEMASPPTGRDTGHHPVMAKRQFVPAIGDPTNR